MQAKSHSRSQASYLNDIMISVRKLQFVVVTLWSLNYPVTHSSVSLPLPLTLCPSISPSYSLSFFFMLARSMPERLDGYKVGRVGSMWLVKRDGVRGVVGADRRPSVGGRTGCAKLKSMQICMHINKLMCKCENWITKNSNTKKNNTAEKLLWPHQRIDTLTQVEINLLKVKTQDNRS